MNLDPASARFDSLTDDDSLAAGFNAGDPGTENVNGLTFNVTFTPAAGDIDSTAEAVNILEIGGDAYGSGLYLLGGELHFISKMNGGGANFISSFVTNDLDFSSGNNMIGVRSSFGPLSAGTEYSVAVIFDPIDGLPNLEIGVLPTGGSLATESYALSGVGTKTNWDGDNSASAFRGANIANFGGSIISTDGNTTDPFHENNINANPFEGAQGQALYWTQESPALIPEASGTLLGLLGSFGLLIRRRR
ncbi:hypothetical protein N9A94_08480 [Akkermansiaceae bacterium]|nr:hypothetical protein [Akkermansiaceae bacterium]MDA7888766.1 hypothetical protein [Akkermansiaceae bacterium]MDB4538006.1 hypothetical protein [Akkermansiaceae bacterium]